MSVTIRGVQMRLGRRQRSIRLMDDEHRHAAKAVTTDETSTDWPLTRVKRIVDRRYDTLNLGSMRLDRAKR